MFRNSLNPFFQNPKCLAYCFFVALILEGCGKPQDRNELTENTGKPSNTSISTEFAQNFTLSQRGDTSVFRVNEGGFQLDYLLLEDSVHLKQFPELKWKWPLDQFVLTSTSQLSFFQSLNQLDKIIGINGTDYVCSEEVKLLIQTQTILPAGNGQVLDFESLARMKAKVVLLSGYKGDEQTFKKLLSLGILPLVFSEWQETHPLGRTEWVLPVGFFTGQLEKSLQLFQLKKEAYFSLVKDPNPSLPKPTVLTGLGYQGVFYVPGGNSYMAKLIHDAGGELPWPPNQNTGSLSVSFEDFFKAGLQADTWINLGTASSKDAVIAADARFQQFKSVQNGKLFNRNKRENQDGWNEYFESSPMHPEKALKDLRLIFSEVVTAPDSLYYYQQLD